MGFAPRLRWWIALAVVVPVLLMLGMAALALQAEPTVIAPQDVGHEDVARALSLLHTHDPRQAQPGVVSSALVRQRDVDVLLSHGLHRWLNAAARSNLQRGRATLQVSLQAPANPFSYAFGRWLNLDLQFEETGGLPVVDRVRIGHLPLPGWLAERAGLYAADRAGLVKELQLAADVVRRVRFSPQQLLVTYAWQGDSMVRLFQGLLTPEELDRLRPYADRLVMLSAKTRPSFELRLTELMGPMFELARQRSSLAGADAALENRAALLVLTLFANGRTVGSLAPVARTWPRPQPARLLLGGRSDFPLHFLVSAVLATEGTTPLSKAIGVYKEVADSRGGSGFSFNDMAANRAGTRFGERAVQAATALQDAVAQGVRDVDLLPRVDDLPEFMPEPEFVRRFGGVGAPAYQAMLNEIDARIATLNLLR